jgi:AcrR family transcriptional regulator
MNRGRQVSTKGHRSPGDRKKPEPRPAFDRRAMRTRTALHEAMIGLVLTRDYEAISVSDIADRANVGRSTFYTHFTGKDDLVRNAAEHLRDMLVAHQRPAARAGRKAAPFGFSCFLFEHTRQQLRLYRALVKGRAGAIILDNLRRVVADFIREDLKALRAATDAADAVPLEAAVQFLVGGFMSMLTWWLDRGAKEPPEKMDAAFRALALRGPWWSEFDI